MTVWKPAQATVGSRPQTASPEDLTEAYEQSPCEEAQSTSEIWGSICPMKWRVLRMGNCLPGKGVVMMRPGKGNKDLSSRLPKRNTQWKYLIYHAAKGPNIRLKVVRLVGPYLGGP